MPIQMNTQRQPTCTITGASIAIINNCPTLMPEIATALARPARPGKARITITPTMTSEAAPLPIANTTP